MSCEESFKRIGQSIKNQVLHILKTSPKINWVKQSLFLIFFTSSLFATVNKPLRWEWDTGYRNDRIHWNLHQPGAGMGAAGESVISYTEVYRDVQLWQNALSFQVIHRDFAFFLKGAYGAFGRGDLTQTYSNLSFTPNHPSFQFNTQGFTADAIGYAGYAVNLTAGRTYEVLLTPLIGYAGHFERLERKGGTPNPYTEGGIYLTSSCPQNFNLTWYGFLFGGDIAVEPGNRMFLRAGYAYGLMKIRVNSQYQYTENGQSIDNQLKTAKGGNPAQNGWAEIAYYLTRACRIGAGGSIYYYPAQVINTTVQTSTSSISSQFKLRWTAIAAWASLSGEF